jgi:hypothetical protein
MAETMNMEETLVKALSHPGIDKTMLKKYSSHLASLKASNLKFERIWWIGIPWPEILNVQTTIPMKNVADIQKLISAEIHSVEIFPLGIPFPDALQAIVKIPLINPRVNETGSHN